jgi:large subunit ribosomal protein L18
MIKKLSAKERRQKRHVRIRKRVFGTAQKPRLSVFRSQRHIYAQLIDDTQARTLVSASSLEAIKLPEIEKKQEISGKALEEKGKKGTSKEKEKAELLLKKPSLIAFAVGENLAKKALEKGISEVVFDRGGFRFHGRVKALAEGARKVGLKF